MWKNPIFKTIVVGNNTLAAIDPLLSVEVHKKPIVSKKETQQDYPDPLYEVHCQVNQGDGKVTPNVT